MSDSDYDLQLGCTICGNSANEVSGGFVEHKYLGTAICGVCADDYVETTRHGFPLDTDNTASHCTWFENESPLESWQRMC